MNFRTRAVQTGVNIDKTFNSVTTPLYPSSTYAFHALGEPPPFDYSRSGNPTRNALEQNLAALEGGVDAVITTTGMASITTVLFLLKPGDHVVTGKDIYGGTYRLFSSVFGQRGIEFSFIDMGNLDEVRAAIRPNTRMIWIETPSNPLMNVTDISGVVEIARKAGVMTVADNTFMSPYFQRPLELGVDIVIESTTKYINGHSDVVGGAIISSTKELGLQMDAMTNNLGTACSPFDAWLVLRGVKTLPQRMEAHAANAMGLAEFLAAHPKVSRVFYPGLKDHPSHELCKRQCSGFGGMLSFELAASVDPRAFAVRPRIFHLAESLGGVESLFCQPWSMTHLSMPEDARRRAGINPQIIRVSVGIEDLDDLKADMAQALDL